MDALPWDMDGLLVDTEPLWTRAEHDLATRLGGTFTPETKAAIVGTRLDVAVPVILRSLGLPATPDAVHDSAQYLLTGMTELFATPRRLPPGRLSCSRRWSRWGSRRRWSPRRSGSWSTRSRPRSRPLRRVPGR